ncbi:MAG: tRNA (guanine-N7-)-methyltransferase [Bacteroidetes bacterium]|nr:MAG: tRNA (guanine-N7-)-methyltransferase [Bacteroidota bacterium]
MAKRKLEHFAEMKTFTHVSEFGYEQREQGHPLRGSWGEKHFGNTNPVVLELGCGKGEYTVELARRYPGKNFIGIDIKGARMWYGAREALDSGLKNAAFLRTRIIWLTFSDPQPEKPRKRLTSPLFLSRYKKILAPGGLVHLKTDSELLHKSTLSVIESEKQELLESSADIYGERNRLDPLLTEIQTTYEKRFLERGMKITYIKMRLR